MRKSVLIIACVAFIASATVSAQVTVGSQKAPETFSVLELIANKNSGLRLPQLTTQQRNDLTASPDFQAKRLAEARGLVIFNINTNCVETWNGSEWISRCAPLPMLTVNPNILTFTSAAGGGGNKNVAVTTTLPGWQIDGAIPSNINLSGAGTGSLTVGVLNANAGTALTSVKIPLVTTGGPVTLRDTITVVQLPDIGNITDTKFPTDVTPYVGAFWRAKQTGERLIRIPRPTAAPVNALDGPWSATVIIGTDWIVLDTLMTSDQNVGWRTDLSPLPNEANVHSYENSSFDAIHSVSGNQQSAGGTMSASVPQIYFRIGLRSTLPDWMAPARYGLVVLVYRNGGNLATQRIWIRQGEEADYLMRPGDPNKAGASVAGGRLLPAKFLPYNLTDPNKNTVTAYGSVPALGATSAGGGGALVKYPTQAGYLFVWSRNTGAYHPTSPIQISSWVTTTPAAPTTWNPATMETCPKGYRRPTDITGTASTGSANNSEIRQSLWINPTNYVPNTNDPTNNVMFGYYADGFFDRRLIGSSVTGNVRSTVASPGPDVAYTGMLFYNQYSYASLFLPVTGYRTTATTGPVGAIVEAGKSGHIWTSTFNTGSSPLQLGYDPSGTGTCRMNILDTDTGVTIRCVKE